MAPGRKRGGKGAKTRELSLGDLVLAKVKGFPAWPAKISRPEDWNRIPDPRKYFVYFFGTAEIAFVAPADIQAFTSEAKNKLSARCQSKTVKYFAQAVQEIGEEFEKLQRENLSGVTDHSHTQNRGSETNSLAPVVDEASEVNGNDAIKREEPDCKLEIDEPTGLGSVLGDCPLRQGDLECQNIKPCSSFEANHSLSLHISSGRRDELSENPAKLVSAFSPSNHRRPKEECSRDNKVGGRFSSVGQNKLTNGHQSKMVGAKKKSEGAKHRICDSALSCDHAGDGLKIKNASGGNMKVPPSDIPRSVLKDGSEKKEKKLMKDKRHLEAADDGQVDMDLNAAEQINVIYRKKMKSEHGCEKQRFQSAEASYPARISKCADTEDVSIARAQMNRKNSSSGISNVDDKTTTLETKRLTLGGKAENRGLIRVKTITNESNYSTYEDDLPPTKRYRQSLESMSSSALNSDNKSGRSIARTTNSVTPNKPRSPVLQLPTKRRAVLRCDDVEDELPKTPIHGGFASKVSAISRVSDPKKKPVMSGESFLPDKIITRNPGTVDDVLSKQVKSARMSNRTSSPPSEQGMEKRSRELSIVHVSPSPSQLDTENLPLTETKPVVSTPKMSPTASVIPPAESQNKQSSKALGNISQKKAPTGANYGLASAMETSTSSLNQSTGGRSKGDTYSEKMKSTVKFDSLINLVEGNPNENIFSLGERLDVGKEDKTSIPTDSKNADTFMSMKNLIAAAQARKKQAHIQNSSRSLPFLGPDADMHGWSPSLAPATLAVESSCTLQVDVLGLHPASPSYDVLQLSSSNQHEIEELEERRVSSGHQATGTSLSGGTEAAVARDAFEGMIETLSRTKESIGRATRLAIDCAKYGIANEVVELLVKKLETETSFHRRVDLFFLVDSITQCSHSQKGIAGASYIPIVQAALPRLIGAAAPTGAGAQENRRQCHKVLRLWLERKILPQSVLRRYMDDMGANDDTSAAGFLLRRPSRAERAIDDPIREMEGMLVDEYGSNATFQLPGLLSSHVFEEEEDEDNFPMNFGNEVADGSPSKHTPTTSIDPENTVTPPSDRRHCILEDVDGELEMEDVSGNQRDEKTVFIDGTVDLSPKSDWILESSNINEELLPSPDSPPLPPGSPPKPPPPPTSPPPRPPPGSSPAPPPPPHPSSQKSLYPPQPFGPSPYTGPLSHVGPPPVLVGHPPLLLQQPLQQQLAFMPQQMPPALPSTVGTSPPSAYLPPPLLEHGGTPTANQRALMVPNTQGPYFDASQRSEVLSQQPSGFPPAAFSNTQEKNGSNTPRPVEYGQSDIYMNPQALQHRQPFLPGGTPFAQRPLHPEHPPSHFSYPNSVQPYQYPPYSLPNISDSSRRKAADELWRMPVNEFNADCTRGGLMAGGKSGPGPSYSHKGYFGPPTERPHPGADTYQPSAPNALRAVTPIPVHGVQMMPSRPGMSAVNWRPA